MAMMMMMMMIIIIMIKITTMIIMKVEDTCHWWMPETDSWELGPKMSRPRYQVHILDLKFKSNLIKLNFNLKS